MLLPARSVLSVIVDFFPISMCYRTLVYGKNNKLPLKGDKAAYFDFNTEKLQKHCCINYFIQGQDIVLKDYSEYPSWLEELLAKDSPHSLSPEDYEYWRQLKKKDRRFKRKRNFFRFRSSFVQRNKIQKREAPVNMYEKSRSAERFCCIFVPVN
ncbi:Large ribosomal subunit protein [Trichinella spiralis]|uniref:Large ribosomal subunit protein n=1 Tax=Trichinella spiralis TaxID=6334 RepID=A0ABR3K9C6_TRISP